MLSDAQLKAFGSDGYLVVPDVVSESVLADLDAEVAALVVGQPPPANKVGFHHYFEHPTRLPVAEPTLRTDGVLALAAELVAPLSIDLGFDHIQIATSIFGWDHEPGGGHIDGYGLPGQTEPATFTLLAGIYLDDESKAGRGNLWVWPGSHSSTSACSASRALTLSWAKRPWADTPACSLEPRLRTCSPSARLARRRGVGPLPACAQPEWEHVEPAATNRVLPARGRRPPGTVAGNADRRTAGVRTGPSPNLTQGLEFLRLTDGVGVGLIMPRGRIRRRWG